jgi:hypothetical protein
MQTVEQLTDAYNQARDLLSERLLVVEDEQRKVLRKYLRGLKSAAAKLADAQDRLASTIKLNPPLFEKPRTKKFDGTKVGLNKSKGKLEYDNDRTVKGIKKHLPDQVDVLINIEEKPVSKALEQLPAETLKKIGVKVIPGKDQVVIKPADSDIEKLIKTWLADLSEWELEQ